MTETAELDIDDEAMRLADLAYGEAIGAQGPAVDAAVAAAAPRIVAAELRRIADESAQELVHAIAQHDLAQDKRDQRAADMWFGKAAALEAEVGRLIARADVLDPPARQED